MNTLVIVESPAKTKTISHYLGKGYTVKASVGHIRDLPKNNKNAIDIDRGFVPRYEILDAKKKIIAELAGAAKKADRVLLATDPDREGEAIAWHVVQALGLDPQKKRGTKKAGDTKDIGRIVFHEITESAVKDALAHPRAIDAHLVKAQEARRVLDRIVGYDLSGLIWKKVRYGLSAGRVQSPALRIIVEREREIRAFLPETYFVITAILTTAKKETITAVCSVEPRERGEAERIVDAAKKRQWSVTGIEERKASRSPRPPFTTSTLQQAANSYLGFAPSRTMSVAQRLYEAGLITYMRTDSTALAREAEQKIGAFVANRYGKTYLALRRYKTASKSAQEAHEAIRPTDVARVNAGANDEQKKLYALIWQRTMASQMAAAQILRTKISANVAGASPAIPDFTASGSRTLFDGWLKADPRAAGEDIELPKVAAGDRLSLTDIENEEKETQPPPRYSEAGLVRELEKRGIGRPSTYASIVRTIQERGYADKEGRALRPTDVGEVVSGFLEKNFSHYVSDTFTADMENKLDDIASGKREYRATLEEFYAPFRRDVDSKKNTEKVTDLGPTPGEFLCPVCAGAMIWKLGRSGKFMSCSRFPDCDGMRTEDGGEISPPVETGEKCPQCKDGKLVERDGKYGRFIACSNYPKCKYVKEDAEAENRRKTGVPCPVCKKGEMMERRGRFGAFFSCSHYPECKNAINARPTGALCPLCGALMMEGTKTIPERCSDKKCANHRPKGK